MNKMYFSDAFLNASSSGVAHWCLNGTTPINSSGPSVATLIGGITCLTFWKGVMPTNAEQNAFTNSNRSADALLRFSGAGAFSLSGKRITANFGTTAFGSVLAAGTIAWFNFGNTDTVTNRPMVFGTVGLAGSGADLILPKINVVINDLWLCTNLYFDVANEATFA